MISTVFYEKITTAFVLLGLIQYPVYGLLIGLAERKRKTAFCVAALAVLHVLTALWLLIWPNRYFSN